MSHISKAMIVGILSLSLLTAVITPATAQPGQGKINSIRDRISKAKSPETTTSKFQVTRQEWKDKSRNRTIPTKIYAPTNSNTKCPIIIFSHGLGGSREAAEYLGTTWANNGFFCVFLQHPGSDLELWQGTREPAKIRELLTKGANGKEAIARISDVKFAIDYLEQMDRNGNFLDCKLDLNKIGMSGHSFGALTSLWIAGKALGPEGQDFGFQSRDGRVKAAIYLSPGAHSGGNNPKQAYSSIKIPGMVVTGSEDTDPIRGSKPTERAANFDYIQAPKQYLIFFDKATHMTFGGRSRAGLQRPRDIEIQKELKTVTTNFWKAYLLNDSKATNWMKGNGLDQFLGQSAKVNKK